jgi:hypothetical protein
MTVPSKPEDRAAPPIVYELDAKVYHGRMSVPEALDAALEKAAKIAESYPLTRTECESINPTQGIAEEIRAQKGKP